MMAETSAWMPFYIGDYTADTMHLDGPKHGAYVLLIIHYWRSGPLPDDDEALAIIARTDLREWKRRIGPVVRRFFRVEAGHLRHKRIDNELANAQANVDQRRAAGLASAAKRARERELNGRSTSVGDPLQRDGQRNAIPSPSPSTSKKDSVLRTGAVGAVAEPDARDRLWSVGLDAFKAMTGTPEGKARAMLGKLVKAARDDCGLVMAVLNEAMKSRPIDPFPWLQEAILARANGREGLSERLGREFNFTIDDLPEGPQDVRQTRDNSQLAIATEIPHATDF